MNRRHQLVWRAFDVRKGVAREDPKVLRRAAHGTEMELHRNAAKGLSRARDIPWPTIADRSGDAQRARCRGGDGAVRLSRPTDRIAKTSTAPALLPLRTTCWRLASQPMPSRRASSQGYCMERLSLRVQHTMGRADAAYVVQATVKPSSMRGPRRATPAHLFSSCCPSLVSYLDSVCQLSETLNSSSLK